MDVIVKIIIVLNVQILIDLPLHNVIALINGMMMEPLYANNVILDVQNALEIVLIVHYAKVIID